MMTRTYLTSDGVKLAVYEHGRGTCDFVFQHGLCGAAAQPAEVMPDLDDARLITLECRGHGASEAGDVSKFSIAQFSDDVAAMVEDLGHPVILGGISMGAAIALRLAVNRPDLVRGLVLARPAWVCKNAPDNMSANALVGELLSKHDASEAQTKFLHSDIAHRLRAEAPDNLVSLNGFFSRLPLHITAALLSRISADGPGVTPQDLAHIAVPTMVIGHADDVVHPLTYAEDLAGLIPHAELKVITSKVRDKAQYVTDFRNALSQFLKKVCHA